MKEFSLLRVWFLVMLLVVITLTIMSLQRPIAYGAAELYDVSNPNPESQVLIDDIISLSDEPGSSEPGTLINNPKLKRIYIVRYYFDFDLGNIHMVNYKGHIYIERIEDVVISSNGFTLVVLTNGTVYEIDPWYQLQSSWCAELCIVVDDEAMTHEEFAEEYMPEQPDYEVQNPELFIDPYYEPEVDIRSIQDNSPGVSFPDDRMQDSDDFSCTGPICEGTYTRKETSLG